MNDFKTDDLKKTEASKKIDVCFQKALEARGFSGAQVLLGKGKERIFYQHYGVTSHQDEAQIVCENTLFDIASLTKVVSTLTLSMLAYQAGKLDLAAPLSSYLKSWQGNQKISVSQLLAHRSGLPDWAPLYQSFQSENMFPTKPYPELKKIFIKKISQISLRETPGAKRIYSDLGFMLLAFILEEIFQEELATLFEMKVAQPLALSATTFFPLKNSKNYSEEMLQSTVASEFCPWRGRLLKAEVHDDNAWALGGVAGHAGLFSRAMDLETWARFFFRVAQGEETYICQKTFQHFSQPYKLDELMESPILGWDTVSPNGSSAGKYFSHLSLGHLAFTGCSLWMDFSDQKYIILLTNRIHSSRDKSFIQAFRPKVHDLLVESFLM